MTTITLPFRLGILFVVAISVCLSFGSVSVAQEITDEHKQAARDAMAATGATDRLDNILPQLASFTKAGLIANRPDIEAEISDTVDEVAISLAERRGVLEQEIVDIYTQNFTQEELKAVTVFFSSEAGTKFLRRTPVLFKEVDQISAVWRNGVNRDLSQQVQEKLKEKGLQ